MTSARAIAVRCCWPPESCSGVRVEIRLELQKPCGFLHALFDLGARLALHPQRRGDVLEDRQRRIIDELLIDHRDRALPYVGAGDVLAVDEHAARGGFVEAGEQAHDRGLARQRRPQAERSTCRARASGVTSRMVGTPSTRRETLTSSTLMTCPPVSARRPFGARRVGAEIQRSRASDLLRRQPQAELGSPPDDVVGGASPFLRHQVPDLGFGQARAERTGRDRSSTSRCPISCIARVP